MAETASTPAPLPAADSPALGSPAAGRPAAGRSAPPPGPAPLFEAPGGRLGRRTHEAVFGLLPASTAHALDDPAVAAAVRPLLDRGWRPAQLAARVGALPPAGDPAAAVAAVTAFLGQLLERDSPQQARDRERAQRARAAAERASSAPAPASEEAKAHWVAQARRSLGLPPRAVAPAVAAPVRACASCPGEGTFFVTRQVRLCGACVELLGSGRARLAVGA